MAILLLLTVRCTHYFHLHTHSFPSEGLGGSMLGNPLASDCLSYLLFPTHNAECPVVGLEEACLAILSFQTVFVAYSFLHTMPHILLGRKHASQSSCF